MNILASDLIKKEGTELLENQTNNSYTGSIVAMLFGIFLMIYPEYAINGITGRLIFFGALTYMARKKQGLTVFVSGKWSFVEFFSIVFVLRNFSIGLLNDNWYKNPLTFTFIPLWILIAYLFCWRNMIKSGLRKIIEFLVKLFQKLFFWLYIGFVIFIALVLVLAVLKLLFIVFLGIAQWVFGG